MATRRTTLQIGSVGFYALLGAVTAFIISGAIRETAYVALGALVGAGIGWLVRQVRRREASAVRDPSDGPTRPAPRSVTAA